nr:hypothetical protein 42 [bacterium]
MYDFDSYEQDSGNNDGGNNNSDSGSSGDGEPDKNLTLTPYAPIEGDIVRVFGNANSWGQSLGVALENVVLVDGCLYHDPEKNKYKVFNWEDVAGVMPSEETLVEADSANQFLVKNYGGTKKRYELVEAIVAENGDDPVDIGNAIMWYGGSDDYGPKSASKTLAKILTTYGREMVVDDSDIHNWLADTSGENILRPDLQDRRVAFFEVKKQSNRSDRKYHHPIVKDVETEADVTVVNGTQTEQGTLDDDGADETEAETEAEPEAPVADGGAAEAAEVEVPAAIEDFISTCQTLGYDDEEKAAALLGDLIEDAGNDLTENMVEAFGGEEAVVGRVFQ